MAHTAIVISEDDEHELMASFKKGAAKKGPTRGWKARSQTSARDSSVEETEHQRTQRTKQAPQKLLAIRVPPVQNREQYIYHDGQDAVQRVRRELEKSGELVYDVELVDGTRKQVSLLRHVLSPCHSCQLVR